MRTNYQVIVGKIGAVYDGHDGKRAKKEFNAWVRVSKDESGRAAGEPVIVLVNGDLSREYMPGQTLGDY